MKKSEKSVIGPYFFFISLICFFWSGGGTGWAAAASVIELHGSDTMLILNQEFTKAYTEQHPKVSFHVLGGGSGVGLADLMEGKTQIAAASRRITEGEKERFKQRTGKYPEGYVVALDGVGLYVHNNNPVTRLTIGQLRGILTGEILNWREVGGVNRPIVIFNRDKNSGTRSFIQEHVLKGAPFSRYAREVASTFMVTSCVSRYQGAIGYGGIAYSEGAHIIRVAENGHEKGIWPSYESVSSGEYPLSRPLYFYVNPVSASKDVRDFVRWVCGPEGQDVVTFVGYYPVQKKKEEPARAEEKPSRTEPVLIHKENMARHGFELTLEIVIDTPELTENQARVTIRFQPSGHTIERIETVSLQVGEAMNIPLSLGEDLSVEFVLAKNLLEQAQVSLAEAGAPEEGAVFLIRPAEFDAESKQ